MSEINTAVERGNVHQTCHGPVSTTQLVKYAGASGDFSRLHFDYPFVREAGLEGVLVHGMLTMAFAATCLSEHVGEHAAITELTARFLSPVLAGDTVQATSTITERHGDALKIELVAKVGEKIVLRGSAAALMDPVCAVI